MYVAPKVVLGCAKNLTALTFVFPPVSNVVEIMPGILPLNSVVAARLDFTPVLLKENVAVMVAVHLRRCVSMVDGALRRPDSDSKG